MKAKLITEIVRGKESAAAALGIGAASMYKGYDYLIKTFPETYGDYFEELDKANEYKSTIAKYPDIIKKATEILNDEESHILQAIIRATQHNETTWIKKAVLYSNDHNIQDFYFNEDFHYYIHSSEYWGMAFVTLFRKNKQTAISKKIGTFYFVRYPNNKYFGT